MSEEVEGATFFESGGEEGESHDVVPVCMGEEDVGV